MRGSFQGQKQSLHQIQKIPHYVPPFGLQRKKEFSKNTILRVKKKVGKHFAQNYRTKQIAVHYGIKLKCNRLPFKPLNTLVRNIRYSGNIQKAEILIGAKVSRDKAHCVEIHRKKNRSRNIHK